MQKKFFNKKMLSVKKDPKMSSFIVRMYDPDDKLILFFAPQSWGRKQEKGVVAEALLDGQFIMLTRKVDAGQNMSKPESYDRNAP